VLFALVPIFAMVGLVTDVGWWYFTTEEARAAAEAAALAAIQSAMDSVKSGGTYTCGSGTLACQSTATGCATTVPNPITSNLQDGCAYGIANGFKNTGTQTVTIQANTTSPPPTVSGVSVLYWVTVRITQTNPLTFLGVLGGTNIGVGVRSTAAVIPMVSTACVIATDPSAAKAVTASGGAAVVANNCGVSIESDNSDALDVSGGATVTASSIDIAQGGGSNGHGCGSCINPTPTTVSSITNPYANLPVPTFSSTCDYTNYNLKSGVATISPGTYCGGITASGGTLTFNSGTYILLGGGLTGSGGAKLVGSNVFFYNTCNPSPCSNGSSNYKPLTVSGGSTATLSANTSGTYSGVIFFQDPTVKSSSQDTVSGGSTSCFTGAIDVSKTPLVYSGGSSGGSCDTSLIADTVTFSGGSNLGSTTATSSGPSAPTAVLIE
jgi:type II secretory pathway pseudopilin PulG